MPSPSEFGASLSGRFAATQIKREVENRIARQVQAMQKEIRDHILQDMASAKHGRVYFRPGRIHVASAPRESPAIDFGTLSKSIRTRYFNKGMTASIDFRTKYASYLESGTRKMKPRPYAQPALNALGARFQRNLQATLSMPPL